MGFVFCFRESHFHVKNFIPSQTKASLGYLTRSLDNMMHAIKFYSSEYLAMREIIASSESYPSRDRPLENLSISVLPPKIPETKTLH